MVIIINIEHVAKLALCHTLLTLGHLPLKRVKSQGHLKSCYGQVLGQGQVKVMP